MKKKRMYVVPSIGRCGSTLIWELMNEALKTEDIPLPNGHILFKTHEHYRGQFKDYKTIYMYGFIGDVIASLCTKQISGLKQHFAQLEILPKHIAVFMFLDKIHRCLALWYLIIGDKFRYKENMHSWKKHTDILFVKYEDLCGNKDKKMQEISSFLGFDLPDFDIKKRKSSFNSLPKFLQKAITKEYSPYVQEFEKIDYKFPFEQELKCIFIHIPKTAGCSITESLFNKPDGLGHIDIHFYKKHLKNENYNNYFKFAFVRNPWDRAVSIYSYLKKGGCGNEFDTDIMERYIKDYETFEEFVLSLKNPDTAQGLLAESAHFRPQYTFICEGEKKFMIDFVARFENIEQDFKYITAKLGLKTVELPHSNKSEHNNYREEYKSQETINIIANLYQEDIELFNYSFY